MYEGSHRSIPGGVLKHKNDRLLLFIVAIPSHPLLYFSCSIVRNSSGVQVLRSANREILFLGWQLCRSALYMLCMFLPDGTSNTVVMLDKHRHHCTYLINVE